MKLLMMCCAALTLASCDNKSQKGMFSYTSAFSPTAAIGAQIFPQTLQATTIVTGACPLVPSITTAFDLVILPASNANLFIDHVTLRLIDGSVVGNPPINYPRPELDQMFGSTLVVANRAFPFRPQFRCGVVSPRFLAADLVLVDGMGGKQNMTVSANFQSPGMH